MSTQVPEQGPEDLWNLLQGPDHQGQVTMRSYTELGKSGLRRWGGYVDEEFLPQLQGRKAVQVYREMSQNDPVIGAMLHAIDMLLRQVSWRVEPASQDPEDLLAAQFVEECMEDMSHTWDDLISEILSMLVYGWSWHEVVYKRRVGDVRNPMYRSKFSDGLVGWRKIPIRSQETLLEWQFDEDGGVQSMVQMAPPQFERTELPIDKALLFRASMHKNNPEGRSILRNSYRPWYFKKKIEEIEGIGIERDLAGLPVAKIPAEFLSINAKDDEKAIADMFRTLVRQVRRDEQEGVVLPLAYEEGTHNPLYEFELLASGGSRNFDTNKIIERYEQRMAMTVLADFILLGNSNSNGRGSYAMHTDKTGIFRVSLDSWARSISNVFNRYELPRLFSLNAWKLDKLPEIVPGEIDPPDLNELGEFFSKLTSSGMVLFPDPELESFVRDAAKLPPKSEQAEWMQQAQAQQQAMMAQQQAAGPPGEDPAQDPAAQDLSAMDQGWQQ